LIFKSDITYSAEEADIPSEVKQFNSGEAPVFNVNDAYCKIDNSIYQIADGE
jgi:hypothetical protein